MRSTLVPALILALAPAALADPTLYTIEGSYTGRGAFRGTLEVSPRADRRFDVALLTRFSSGETCTRGTVGGTGTRLEGDLLGTPGLAGGLTGNGVTRAGFVATIDVRTGAIEGRVIGGHGLLTFRGTRHGASEPAGPAYQARSAADKQAAVWREMTAAPYGTLPEVGSRGVGSSVWDTLQALRTRLLDKTFSVASDVRPPRTKLFHPFGSVATVKFEAAGGHPFTGFFATGGEGLARLSLATDEKTFIPGIALKLFVNGRPSVNIHAIPSFDPQTSRDFFARSPSNEIPPPTNLAIKLFSKIAAKVADPLRRPVDHVAAARPDGAAVAAPVAPRRIHFRPAGVHFAADDERDFRDMLATIPAGTVIYTVYAETPQGEVKVGDVRLTSKLVASEWGDRVLHFEHAR